MTLLTLAVIISEVKDGVVGHKVLVVEEETVQTKTVSKFEVFSSIPLVLCIDTSFVELNTCCRIGVSVITIGKADYLRGCTVDEIVNACITIVSCTVSHVSIVSHLVLIVETHGKLMVSSIIYEVILDVCDSVVNCVVPSEELISESHILSVCSCSVLNVDEWELLRVCSTDIVKF